MTKRVAALVRLVLVCVAFGFGLRRLLLRGFAAARAELRFIALTHNLLELFRSRSRPAMLAA